MTICNLVSVYLLVSSLAFIHIFCAPTTLYSLLPGLIRPNENSTYFPHASASACSYLSTWLHGFHTLMLPLQLPPSIWVQLKALYSYIAFRIKSKILNPTDKVLHDLTAYLLCPSYPPSLYILVFSELLKQAKFFPYLSPPLILFS